MGMSCYFPQVLLLSTLQYEQYLCPSHYSAADIFSAKIHADRARPLSVPNGLSKFKRQYFFCNGTDAVTGQPAGLQRMTGLQLQGSFLTDSTPLSASGLGDSAADSSCDAADDLSAAGTGWTSWFQQSDFAQRVRGLGFSEFASYIQAKQAQTACLAQSGVQVQVWNLIT